MDITDGQMDALGSPTKMKRQRLAVADADADADAVTAPQGIDDSFGLTFDCTSALRTMVEVVSAILTRAEFHVCKLDNAGEGSIKVESIDPKKTCLVVAHLQCRLSGYTGKPCFCVNTSDLNLSLRSVPAFYAVDMRMQANSEKLNVSAYEALTKTHEINFDISTLVSDDAPIRMSDLDYKLVIEVETASLRRIVRNCLQLHGQDLTFRVQQPVTTSEGSKKRYTVLTIESEGTTVRQHERFHSVTDERDGEGSIIRTEHEQSFQEISVGNLETKFEASFDASYLSLFLKPLDKNQITMRLARDENTHMPRPLILTYPLGGGEDSYVCMVLAAKASSN